jgi:D-alanyl-D-alanine carboxypeptidase
MGLKRGETYTLRELLYGLILVSGNDAAVAIADSLSGSMPQFVMRMNQRATELGLHDTHFMNPHGLLANGHYSSAHDLAFLGRYSLNIPVIHQITGTREYRIRKNAAHPERFLTNSNQFLWWYPGTDGGKPGWDGNKNFVQVITCQQNKRRLIGVTIHTNDWWTDMRNLMNWGFNTFKWISPAEIQQTSPIPFAAAWNFFVQDKKDNSIPTTDKGRYYIYTGYSVSNPILTYFEKNGGRKKFGFPISMPVTSFNTVVSQKFERGTLQCDLGTKQCHSS